jgi:hypothetical protein
LKISATRSKEAGRTAPDTFSSNDNDTINVNFGSSLRSGDFFTATVAHEGTHVDQDQTWVLFGEGPFEDFNHYAREAAAWEVGAEVAQALGMKCLRPHGGGSEFDVWNKGWKAADVQTLRSKGIGNILNQLYQATPSDTDTFSSEHHH